MRTKIPFDEAAVLSAEVCLLLKPFCTQLTVAGTMLEGKPEVDGIDLLVVPKNLQTFPQQVESIFSTSKGGTYANVYFRVIPVTQQTWNKYFNKEAA